MAPVEARSLANLITLASNPPQYPRNPTAEALEPLVLYLARVPGSKGKLAREVSPRDAFLADWIPLDVFLTTIKPRQKVVTAEDVSSCLYFLHFEQESDGEFTREVQHARHDQHQGNMKLIGNENPVLRKPLAARPSQSSGLGDVGSYSLATTEKHHKSQLGRKPVEIITSIQASELTRDSQSRSLPSNHPFGPCPDRSPADSAKNMALWHEYTQSQICTPPSTSVRRVPAPVPHQIINSSYSHILPSSHNGSVNSEQQGLPKHHESLMPCQGHGTHARSTLIRRDPGSGAQWNVGIISYKSGTIDPVLEAVTDLSSSPSVDTRAGIDLEIRTPGYNRFIAQQEIPECGYPRQDSQDKTLLRAEDPPALPARPFKTIRPQDMKTFRRNLMTENTGFWNRSRRSSRPGSCDLADGNGDSNRTRPWRRKSAKDISADMHDYDQILLASDRLAGRRQSLVPKATSYVFLSPWGGRCEFTTGHGGSTLKCKHTLPATSSGTSQPSSATVSELRFNFPSSTAPATSSNITKALAATKEVKRSSLFHKHHSSEHVTRPSSGHGDVGHSSDARGSWDDDTLDLSLGRENAGGGFGGKKAKLGKLIIDEEGLKMLDLVVAANMGIWWKAYQRIQGEVT
ncbi:MAG: hypothetical protein M1836_000262 [Candelina mexicana]|nr:MAG: hypothetical protein M1836_000262 [Candelina mexicana]